MNLDKEIVNIKTRKPYIKSFPTEDEKTLAVNDKGVFDDNLLPKETVGNVILNCLAMIPGETKIHGFYANAIAQLIFGDEREIELKDKFKTFLSSHLEKSIIKTIKNGDKEEVRGLYAGWIISQVLEEMGEDFEA